MRTLALLAALALTGSLAADKKAKDEEAIIGTWKVEKIETGGPRNPSAEEIADMRITFKKDGKGVITGIPQQSKPTSEFEYKINASAKLKTIDFTGADAKLVGIYELDGDSLKLCAARGDRATRPTEFKADGKGVVIQTLKRVKEEKKDK
jgi:uncharacterized protein (TIGR03067 family)